MQWTINARNETEWKTGFFWSVEDVAVEWVFEVVTRNKLFQKVRKATS